VGLQALTYDRGHHFGWQVADHVWDVGVAVPGKQDKSFSPLAS